MLPLQAWRERLAGLARTTRGLPKVLYVAFLASLRERPVVTIAALLGAIALGRLVLLQLSTLPLPLMGFEGHHWRQAFTYGVAWNYAHTTLDPLHPRMFLELPRSSNIVAMEAPLYPLIASLLLRIGRDHIFGPRLLSYLSLVAGSTVLFRFFAIGRSDARDVWADRAGLFVALACSVTIGTDFRSVQPEPLCAGLTMLAAWYFARYRDSEVVRDAALGGTFAALALLTKPLALGVLPGIALFGIWGRGRFFRRGVTVALSILPGLVVYLLWDRWAAHLLKTEMHGHIVISIQHDKAEMLRNLKNMGFFREGVFHFLANYAGSWWLVPAFVAGIFRSLADRKLARFGAPFLLWLVGYMVELLAFGDRLHSNAYYFILAPLPVAFFSAVGLGGFVRALESARARPPALAYRVALALTLLLPLGLMFFTPTNWKSSAVPDLAFEKNYVVWTDDLGLALMFVTLLVAIALGGRLSPPRIPRWIAIPVLGAVFASGVWAFRTSDQYLRFFAAVDKRAGFRPELAALRASVDRYSTVNDRVVMNSGEMVDFYLPLRNCFASGDAKSPAQLQAARARGARLYLHIDYDRPETRPELDGPLLERGKFWRLYCIDEAGCSPR